MDTLSQNDIEAFEQLAHSFCKKSLLQFIDENHPDGNFFLFPSLIQEGCAIGIISKADSDAEGYEYGIWGKKSLDSEYGIITSLVMLSTLASISPTFAFFTHIQGLASNILIQNNITQTSAFPFLSLYDGFLPPHYLSLQNPSSISLQNTIHNDYLLYTIGGYGYDPYYAIICLPYNGEWRFLYFDNTTTVLLNPHRTHGLRGLIYSARFNSKITNSFTGDMHTIEFLFACFWLGIAAIALGNAQHALEKALEYTYQRYQRGSTIRHIESVQMMLGSAQCNIDTAKKTLLAFNKGDSSSLLLHAAECKLNVTTLCSKAITDCLQIFGGYGYMEDFGIERMFRDSNALATIGGSPFFMKQFIAQMQMED